MTHIKRVSDHDDFYTPKWAIDLLLDRYNFNDKTIWECASGIGNITNEIKPYCKEVHETDIKQGQDFLSYKPNFDFDCIVTNPPFSLKTEFIEKCISYNKDFYLLLPLTSIEGVKRHRLIKQSDYHLTILLPDRRTNYINQSNKSSPSFVSAWFCFNKINVFEKQLITLELINSDKYLKASK